MKMDIINEKLIETIKEYGEDTIDSAINHENDYNFDYFAWRSLQEMYLLKKSNGKVIERPQHMYMRIALWVTTNIRRCVGVLQLFIESVNLKGNTNYD